MLWTLKLQDIDANTSGQAIKWFSFMGSRTRCHEAEKEALVDYANDEVDFGIAMQIFATQKNLFGFMGSFPF